MKNIKIGNKIIGPGQPVFFIAEAGVNHNGSIKNAKKLIDIAKKCGADAVKFQSFNTEDIILKNAPKSKYHIETTGNDKKQTWFQLLQSQEMSHKMHYELIEYCKKKKIIFLSTPYDFGSVDLLDKLGVQAFKIASTDNQNLPLLKYIAKKNKPVILSTAMSTMEEIKLSYQVLNKKINNKIIILQCTGNYPSKINDCNLNVMQTYKKNFKCIVGYSDHTEDYLSVIAATASGALVIEKHFTINKNMYGPDHRMSMTPDQLKKTIKLIRDTTTAMGGFEKILLTSEKENRKKLKKSIVSKKFIEKGEKLHQNLFEIKRPGTGILPKFLSDINKYISIVDIKLNTIIKQNMIKKIKKYK